MSQELIPPFLFSTITLMAIESYCINRQDESESFSGRSKSSLVFEAARPIAQHKIILNFHPLFLLVFKIRETSNVLVRVTIGIGDDIHNSNAAALEVSLGFISFFITFFCFGMIITLSESKFLSAIPPEPLFPGRSGNAQTVLYVKKLSPLGWLN